MLEKLPPLSRLALAYAPTTVRDDWLSLLALDARLASVVRQAREPMLAQLRVAWWRDRFAGDPATWPKGEPLLARLTSWNAEIAGLGALVDGWEALLADPPLVEAACFAFAEGRTAAVATLARRWGVDEGPAMAAGRAWSLADLALHLGEPKERAVATTLAVDAPIPARLPRPLRPLAVLAGLSLRAVHKGSGDALSGPGALLAAIRLGFLGR